MLPTSGNSSSFQVVGVKWCTHGSIHAELHCRTSSRNPNFYYGHRQAGSLHKWQWDGKDDEYEAQDQWPDELRRERIVLAVDYIQAQRARGKLLKKIRAGFTVDAFIGNVTDWEKVCMGNLVGLPVMVVPTGLTNIS